jgi:NAD dependent epimerase/dehydratase family enzyme
LFIPAGPPDAMLQLMLGEVAGVVTAGQKVLPKKAMSLGYHFRHPELQGALHDVFKDKPKPVTTVKPVAASAGAHH